MNAPVIRFVSLLSAALLGLVLSGCHSAQEFEYNGAKLDTLNAISIDNRTPYPLERDTWRLGPTREVVADGEEIAMGASEDGSTIMFKIAFYPLGAKSKLIKQSTERSTKALTAIIKDLQDSGYKVSKRIAIVDHANVIGYKFGGPARIIGFYVFSTPGAYDALLTKLDPQAAVSAPVEAATETEQASEHTEHAIEE